MAVIGKLNPNAYDIEDDDYLDAIEGQFEILGEVVIAPAYFRAGNTSRSNNYLIRLPRPSHMAVQSNELYWGVGIVKDGIATFDSYMDEDLYEYTANETHQKLGGVHLWIMTDAIEVISGLSNKYHRNKLDLI